MATFHVGRFIAGIFVERRVAQTTSKCESALHFTQKFEASCFHFCFPYAISSAICFNFRCKTLMDNLICRGKSLFYTLHPTHSAQGYLIEERLCQILLLRIYSTVTDLARFLGWSTLHPLSTAMWQLSNCMGMTVRTDCRASTVLGTWNRGN